MPSPEPTFNEVAAKVNARFVAAFRPATERFGRWLASIVERLSP